VGNTAARHIAVRISTGKEESREKVASYGTGRTSRLGRGVADSREILSRRNSRLS
jgi:hypothetical protein